MRVVPLFLGAVCAAARENPIRRVVTLLQEMQKEIETEIETERKQMAKFECYCKKNNESLSMKVSDAQTLVERTNSEVEGNEALKKQTALELVKAKKDRKNAEANLVGAEKKREEEKKKYDEDLGEQKSTIEAINKAVAALEKGMGKSFLQTSAASVLERVMASSPLIMNSVDVADQEIVESFLQSKTGNSGEIVGILKQMGETMDEALGGMVKDEEDAVKSFGELSDSLESLIKTSTASIESKTELKGEIAMKVVEGKNLASTTAKEIEQDAATLFKLKESCADKGGEFAQRQKDAALEVDAIGQAIGVLNSDDALTLFNKTDTRPAEEAASFLETGSKTATSPIVLAKQYLSGSKFQGNTAMALMALSVREQLKSKKVDMSKVIKMIDDMEKVLKEEGKADIKARDSCTKNLSAKESEQKEAAQAVTKLSTRMEELTEQIAAKHAVIEKHTASIAEAETSMATSTEERKAANAEFVEVVGLNAQAVQLLEKAKNKMAKFYDPENYKEEAPVEGAEGEVAAMLQQPEVAMGKSKSGGANKVNSLMDKIIGELNMDTKLLEVAEKQAQKDYEELSADLAAQVTQSKKAIQEAQTTMATAEENKATASDDLALRTEEEATARQSIADLHAQCDFILGAFEERREARTNEIAGLGKAKMVLAGGA